MGGITNGWFMVCVEDEVKDKFVVTNDKTNG
jgi:hypothetical protein